MNPEALGIAYLFRIIGVLGWVWREAGSHKGKY